MNSELIFENRFEINENISNRKLKKLCRYYKTYYFDDKKRTVDKLQNLLNKKRKVLKEYKINNNEECVICYKMLTDNMLITRCLHAYCDVCIVSYLNLYSMNCPVCRRYYDSYWFIQDKQIKEEDLNKIIIENTIPQIIEYDNLETEEVEIHHLSYLRNIYNFISTYKRCITYLIILCLINNLYNL